MTRLSLSIALLSVAVAPPPSETPENAAAPPLMVLKEEKLVHVHGRFIDVKATGKRHQSYLFSFRVDYELRGTLESVARDELVCFELAQDNGGRDLLQQLRGTGANGRIKLEEVKQALPASPHYSMALWLFPAKSVARRGTINAALVNSPLRHRD